MESQTIISTDHARKILRKFDLPSQLLEEAQLVDIINKLDSIANIYIIGLRENKEHQNALSSGAQALD